MSNLWHGGWFALKQRALLRCNRAMSGRSLVSDSNLGYSVWRTWFPWEQDKIFPEAEIGDVIAAENPDLVIVGSGQAARIAEIVQRVGIPLLMHFVDVEFQDHGGSIGGLGKIPCVANSRFTAKKHHEAFGVRPVVIYPFIPKELYRTETTREFVTFVNASTHKGLDLALSVARLSPEIPFTFVGGHITFGVGRKLGDSLDIPTNVDVRPAEPNMRLVYARAKVLLVPSLWEEGYGRVVTEAQVSGIPSIASKRGGLPEAVGRGGVLIDAEGPVELWVDALRKLWGDEAYYSELATDAKTHSQRRELDPAFQVDEWERVLYAAAKGVMLA